MGLTVNTQLIDRRRCRDVVAPALAAFAAGDPRALVSLVRRAAEVAPDLDAIDTRPDLDDPEYLALERAAETAYRLEGDHRPAEALARLTRDFMLRSRGPSAMSREELEEAADLIERDGRTPDTADLVSGELTPALVELLCVPWGCVPRVELELSNSRIVGWLTTRSAWIEQVITSEVTPGGAPLEVPYGDATEVFSQEDLARLEQELLAVGRPTADRWLAEDFDDLVTLVRTARRDPELALVLVTA